MLKVLLPVALISAGLLCLLYFLLSKKRGCAYENLTSAYNVKLKRNRQRQTRKSLFYKAVNALAAWAFFAGYFLNDTVFAKDSHTNKYQNDNYFKYDINLYSPKKTGLPADCPPKVALNQVYSSNKLLAVTDCIPGSPGSNPGTVQAPVPHQAPCAGQTPCVNSPPPPPPPPAPPCVIHAITPPPCTSGGNAAGNCYSGGGGGVGVCSNWYVGPNWFVNMSDCVNFTQGVNPSTGVCIYNGQCGPGGPCTGQINNQGLPANCASANCATANCAQCMGWP